MKIKFYARKNLQLSSLKTAVSKTILKSGFLFLGMLLLMSFNEKSNLSFFQKMMQKVKTDVAETLMKEGLMNENLSYSLLMTENVLNGSGQHSVTADNANQNFTVPLQSNVATCSGPVSISFSYALQNGNNNNPGCCGGNSSREMRMQLRVNGTTYWEARSPNDDNNVTGTGGSPSNHQATNGASCSGCVSGTYSMLGANNSLSTNQTVTINLPSGVNLNSTNAVQFNFSNVHTSGNTPHDNGIVNVSAVNVASCPPPCNAGTTAPPLSSNSESNSCPDTTVDLDALHTGSVPATTALVWSTDNDASNGLASTEPSPTSNAGIYYAYYHDATNSCYSPQSQAVTVTINGCGCTDPDLYADNCDFDMDGILNADDVDDDNDGVLDTDECDTTPTSLFGNNTYEQFSSIPTGASQLNLATGWFNPTGATPDYYMKNSSINYWYAPPATLLPIPDGDGFVGTVTRLDGNFSEYIGRVLTTPMVTGTEYRLDYFVGVWEPYPDGGGTFGGDAVVDLVLMGVETAPNPSSTPVTSSVIAQEGNFDILSEVNVSITEIEGWKKVSMIFTPTKNYEYIFFGPRHSTMSITSGYAGAYLTYDVATVNESNTFTACDTDNDLVDNRFDLDSDADGCSDAFEAGATADQTTDFQFPANNVGANGLDDSLEGAGDDGVINYTSTYSDATDDQVNNCLTLEICDNGIDDDGDGAVDCDDFDCNPFVNYFSNPSMEAYSQCPNLSGTGTIEYADGWKTSQPAPTQTGGQLMVNDPGVCVSPRPASSWSGSTNLSGGSDGAAWLGMHETEDVQNTLSQILQAGTYTFSFKAGWVYNSPFTVGGSFNFYGVEVGAPNFSTANFLGNSGNVTNRLLNTNEDWQSYSLTFTSTKSFDRIYMIASNTLGGRTYLYFDEFSVATYIPAIELNANCNISINNPDAGIASYNFYKDGIFVGNSTATTFEASEAGNYTVKGLTSGGCETAASNGLALPSGSCLDTDMDGILDPIDKDDDNDGILDRDEMQCQGGANINLTENLTAGPTTTPVFHPMDTWLVQHGIRVRHVNVSTLAYVSTTFGVINTPSWTGEGDPDNKMVFGYNISGSATGVSIAHFATDGVTKQTTQNFAIWSDPTPATTVRVVAKDVDGNVILDRIDPDGTKHIVTTDDTGGVPIHELIFANASSAIDLITVLGNCTDLDFDNDGIANRLDLDADNDGIPDNVEAQSTSAYMMPSGIDLDLDGLDDVYDDSCDLTDAGGAAGNADECTTANFAAGTPIVIQNSDTDANPDYLDLDSDEDGINDIVEAGNGALDTDADGKTNGTVGVNGLDNTLETADDWTDTNGNILTTNDPAADLPNNQNAQSAEVDYRDASLVPEITNNNSDPTDATDFVENGTGIVNDFNATDANGDEEGTGANDELDWSITGGADAALFSINDNGELTFIAAPDYENPMDAGTDNMYVVEVTITDPEGNTDVQTLTVTVTDEDEDMDGFTGVNDPDDANPCVPDNTVGPCCEAGAPTISND